MSPEIIESQQTLNDRLLEISAHIIKTSGILRGIGNNLTLVGWESQKKQTQLSLVAFLKKTLKNDQLGSVILIAKLDAIEPDFGSKITVFRAGQGPALPDGDPCGEYILDKFEAAFPRQDSTPHIILPIEQS